MRKLIFVCLTAVLAIPAWAAASTPTPADHSAAVKQCSTERTTMGHASVQAALRHKREQVERVRQVRVQARTAEREEPE